jgi:hypothetical protein
MEDWFDGAGSGGSVDIEALIDSKATELLMECVGLGALVSMGTTSDGGALGVTITVDGRWRREYFRDAETFLTWMAEAVPAVRSATEARSASSVPRKRERRSRGL